MIATRAAAALVCLGVLASASAQQPEAKAPSPASLSPGPVGPGAVPTWHPAGPTTGDLGALPPQPGPSPAPPPGIRSDGPATGTPAPLPSPPETPAPPRPPARADDRQADVGRTQHALFDRLPVQLLLSPEQERLVQFPFVASMDVPAGLQGLLEVQIIEDTAYLTANAPFPRARLYAQAIDGSATVPLDIESVEGVRVPPMLRVHLPDDAAADGDGLTESRWNDEPAVDMIQLTRYAAQMLYAPARLLPTLPGVRQEPVDRSPVVGLYRGGQIETAPLGAWSSGSLYVTAVRLTNRTGRAIDLELDMRWLRGQWIAATPQHWRLSPHGAEADTTAVYLVSDRPFAAVPLWR
jgi:integrating conjugative element protein (TIGR03749 family)